MTRVYTRVVLEQVGSGCPNNRLLDLLKLPYSQLRFGNPEPELLPRFRSSDHVLFSKAWALKRVEGLVREGRITSAAAEEVKLSISTASLLADDEAMRERIRCYRGYSPDRKTNWTLWLRATAPNQTSISYRYGRYGSSHQKLQPVSSLEEAVAFCLRQTADSLYEASRARDAAAVLYEIATLRTVSGA